MGARDVFPIHRAYIIYVLSKADHSMCIHTPRTLNKTDPGYLMGRLTEVSHCIFGEN